MITKTAARVMYAGMRQLLFEVNFESENDRTVTFL